MLQKIKKDELILFQMMSHPVASAEILFHEFDSLGVWDKNKFGNIRKYQYPMLSWHSLLLYDKKKSKEENRKIENGLAECYNLGGRLTGKSRIGIILDSLNLTLKKLYVWCVISSFDKSHVQEIMDTLIHCFENHKIFKLLHAHSTKSPIYNITFDNGCKMQSVNQNITSKNPGGQFHQKHFDLHFMEEASFLTKQVADKMFMSKSEKGVQNRWCIKKGTKILMSDFSTKNIEDIEKGDHIIAWDDNKKYLTKTTVLNKWDSGKRDVIKISDGRNYLWLTPEHKLRVRSSGESIYKWCEASKCVQYKLYTKSLSYIDNLEDYKKGLFLGMLESDGTTYEIKKMENTYYQYLLFQADEVRFVDWLLKELKITHSKTLCKKSNGWNKKDFYRYIIKRENNIKIKEWFKLFKTDKDVMYGFLTGFIIGDGYVNIKYGNCYITQSYKKHKTKCDLVEFALNTLHIKYTRYKRISNSSYSYSINKYEIPIYHIPCCTKSKKYEKLLLHITRPIFQKEQIYMKGFLEAQQVYDIETKTKSFIANGFIVHNSGMTNFTKMSPMGEIFFDINNKKKIVNIPSYANPTWTNEDEKNAVKQFGGADSPGYKVEIDGKVIEGMESVFDILRVRETYITDKQGDGIPIKSFEVNKENFHRYKEILVLERPANAEQLGIYFDVGEGGAPSEYIIISKTNNIFRYIYRITTFQLSPDEEQQFVDTLIELLQPTQVGLDHTSGLGKSMLNYLIKKYPDNGECFIPVDFNKNIEIGIKKDSFGKVVINKITNNPELETVRMPDWSIQCLKDIFYQKKIECYEDIKFDTQMNNIIAIRNKQGKILYDCKGANHLFQAWQVFAISNWIAEFEPINPIVRKKPGFGTFSSK